MLLNPMNIFIGVMVLNHCTILCRGGPVCPPSGKLADADAGILRYKNNPMKMVWHDHIILSIFSEGNLRSSSFHHFSNHLTRPV